MDANGFVTASDGSKKYLVDGKLSWKAKGILSAVLGVERLDMIGLADIASDAPGSLRSGIKELEKAGYSKQFRLYMVGRKGVVQFYWSFRESRDCDFAEAEATDTDESGEGGAE